MKKPWVLMGIAGALIGVALTAYTLGRARADGVPTIEPLAYGGTLLESDAPVTGTRNVGLTMWTDATSTSGASLACTTTAGPVAVTSGRFRLVLDATCVDAVHRYPDLWVEISVGGTALPREHVGAVPYALESANGVPPGTVVSFAGGAVPVGWLACDGSALQSSAHPRLFAAIGTAWGNGSSDTDATTDFNLPDLRGRFLRGVDDGAGADPDAVSRVASSLGGNSGDRVGTMEHGATALPTTPFQTDVSGAHSHDFNGYWSLQGGTDHQARARTLLATDPTDQATTSGGTHSHGVATGGDHETRPVNAAVVYIVRD